MIPRFIIFRAENLEYIVAFQYNNQIAFVLANGFNKLTHAHAEIEHWIPSLGNLPVAELLKDPSSLTFTVVY